MSTDITIAAVGDFLMKTRIINSAKVSDERGYSFDKIFDQVAPYLRNTDFTIGNLETNFGGTGSDKPSQKTIDAVYSVVKRHPKTGWPMFNCPDQFAGTLKNLGFDVLTTANNHCMDCGINGLKRTLKVLDSHGLAHTGTYRSQSESQQYLIKDVKGIKIGVLAYTKTTNRIPVPSDQTWAVNLIQPSKIIADIKKLKAQAADLVIVCLHFGREYGMFPNDQQKSLIPLLFKNGADIILGAHSHVIQPALFYKVKDNTGVSKQRFAIYSLGNFISTRLYWNDHTLTGLITHIHIRKNDDGTTQIMNVEFIPTWTRIFKSGGRSEFRILPLKEALNKQASSYRNELDRMKKMYEHVKRHIKRNTEAAELKVL
ncbi:CapA family protein [Paenibacillus prosopidis]|uniref:Poly-gamma-glutamate synthesis protein (Capsule biosynthesis protein) n=1 Tax=Paenibacillus prosopidis TaxID=630520 RepID=A0A368W4S3_9BACL|nr:CapA family protein [Paenibacillus prosopidis]RCW48568.1 poly-gamma-glutamate synthesis protein (capsule biosynthesis protein) [Paenibacillus prosopidis]